MGCGYWIRRLATVRARISPIASGSGSEDDAHQPALMEKHWGDSHSSPENVVVHPGCRLRLDGHTRLQPEARWKLIRLVMVSSQHFPPLCHPPLRSAGCADEPLWNSSFLLVAEGC